MSACRLRPSPPPARHLRLLRYTWAMRQVLALVLMVTLAACGSSSSGERAWTTETTREVESIDWALDNPDRVVEKLDGALAILEKESATEGRTVYLRKVAEGFVELELHDLETALRSVDAEPSHYAQSRALLKAYLTLTDQGGSAVDVRYASATFAVRWCARIRATTRRATYLCEATGRHPLGQLQPHLAYFFERARAKEATLPRRDEQLVADVRRTLGEVPRLARYLAMFVEDLASERRNPLGDDSLENLVHPSVSLARVLAGRRPLAPARGWVLDQESRRKDPAPFEVSGSYTESALRAVYERLDKAEVLLKDEAWVIPLDDEEKLPRGIPTHLKRLSDEYEQRYISAWTRFASDMVPRSPSTLEEAREILEEITRNEPFVAVMNAILENTRWTPPLPPRPTGGLRVGGPASRDFTRIESRFRSLTTFVTGRTDAGKTTTPDHTTYVGILRKLLQLTWDRLRDEPSLELPGLDAEFAEARREVEALLAPHYDLFAVGVLKAWLLAPLTIARATPVAPPSSAQTTR